VYEELGKVVRRFCLIAITNFRFRVCILYHVFCLFCLSSYIPTNRAPIIRHCGGAIQSVFDLSQVRDTQVCVAILCVNSVFVTFWLEKRC